MAEIKTEINVADVEPVRSLLEVLVDNFSELPEPVQAAMQCVVDGAGVTYDSDSLRTMIGGNTDGVTTVPKGWEKDIHAVNMITRTVSVRFGDDSWFISNEKPPVFGIYKHGKKIIGWG